MVTIHQFNPEIYPLRLWITITDDKQALVDKFVDSNDDELNIDILDGGRGTVFSVLHREDRLRGILMVFKKKKYMTTEIITHEATHATRFIWNIIREHEYKGVEAEAYLASWVARCCDNVRKYKPLEDGQANNIIS